MSARPLLMIPGPTENNPKVYEALATPTYSHVDPAFIAIHGRALKQLRAMYLAPKGQPLLIGANASIGWDMLVSNTIPKGSKALVINTGYFGDSFATCIETYGIHVDQLTCAVGDAPSCDALRAALGKADYACVTITQVDTSTGVLAPVQEYAAVIHDAAPNALIFIDGVCAHGGEELRFDDWGIDGAMTGGQKAIGAPPGVAIMMLSPRAVAAAESLESPTFFGSIKRWLPIMKAYEGGTAAYFSTPPTNEIVALVKALDIMLECEDGSEPTSAAMDGVFARHKDVADRFKRAMASLGLGTVPVRPEIEAHTMTGVKQPEGKPLSEVLPGIKAGGAVVAGGLHKDIKTTYFRVGHMGYSTNLAAGGDDSHLVTTIKAIAAGCGLADKADAAVAAYRA